MSAGIALLVRHPGENVPDDADRLPLGTGELHARIAGVTRQYLLALCRVVTRVAQPGDPGRRAPIAGDQGLDPMPLGISYEISEYGSGLLDPHLMHTPRIQDVKDVKVYCALASGQPGRSAASAVLPGPRMPAAAILPSGGRRRSTLHPAEPGPAMA